MGARSQRVLTRRGNAGCEGGALCSAPGGPAHSEAGIHLEINAIGREDDVWLARQRPGRALTPVELSDLDIACFRHGVWEIESDVLLHEVEEGSVRGKTRSTVRYYAATRDLVAHPWSVMYTCAVGSSSAVTSPTSPVPLPSSMIDLFRRQEESSE